MNQVVKVIGSNPPIPIHIKEGGSVTPADIKEGGMPIKYYEGEYEVTPKVYAEVTLETKNKTMKDDVTVKKVPVYKTKNATGGYTVYVAESVD